MNIETAAREVAYAKIVLENAQKADAVLMGLGSHMMAVREAKRATLLDLSKRTGVKTDTIYAIEHGGVQPRLSTLVTLAVGLGVSIDEYIGFPEPTPVIFKNNLRKVEVDTRKFAKLCAEVEAGKRTRKSVMRELGFGDYKTYSRLAQEFKTRTGLFVGYEEEPK